MTTNRLINEKSPYLLQHAHNPVDWYPWSDEAFNTALNQDKPIFLSIGYSTCHWCHVMEKESFEDFEVAELMNKYFINIKVDREERPDIDSIYMDVCHLITGSGGWPLTIIMTPDKIPFFAGTYFPKYSKWGRVGMVDLLTRINELWLNNRDMIHNTSQEILKNLLQNNDFEKSTDLLNETSLENAFLGLLSAFDRKNGGFGTAPKFPMPHNLSFLLRYFLRTNNDEALNIVEKSLVEMSKGGIFDQIGFGFHRYSTDEKWLVPHFEKMIYDQALHIIAYVEAYLVTKNDYYKEIAQQTIHYVLRDMTSNEGGFYSAEDADSEGKEGKFYLWKLQEVNEILQEKSDIFAKYYNISEKGNFLSEINHEFTGENIPHISNSKDNISKELGISLEVLENTLTESRKLLFNMRVNRIHPLKDDKILTDWNGLMIAALSKAAKAFSNNNYLISAENAVEFISNNLINSDGFLLHRYRDGSADIIANLDDYAFLVWGLIELYMSSFNINYLEMALQLNDFMIELFYDTQNGGFFFTSDKSKKIMIRKKDLYDGAIPSGNSIALLNNFQLANLTGNQKYLDIAEKTITCFSNKISKAPGAYCQFMSALSFAFGKTNEIVIVEGNEGISMNDLTKFFNSKFLHNSVILLKNEENKSKLRKIAPFTENMNAINNRTTIFVCKNFECKLPVTTFEELEKFYL